MAFKWIFVSSSGGTLFIRPGIASRAQFKQPQVTTSSPTARLAKVFDGGMIMLGFDLA
jgi:hypothetical protein